MSKVKVEVHHFDESKKKLEKFSKNLPKKVKFDDYKKHQGGLGGLFKRKHHISGKEMNEFTDTLEDIINDEIYKNMENIIKQFKVIYETFDYLDKEYIKGILKGVKCAELASSQAKDAAYDAKKAQKDVDRTIANLQKAIEVTNKRIDELNSKIDNMNKE